MIGEPTRKPVRLLKDGNVLLGTAVWDYPVDYPPAVEVPALDQRLFAEVWERRGWAIDWDPTDTENLDQWNLQELNEIAARVADEYIKDGPYVPVAEAGQILDYVQAHFGTHQGYVLFAYNLMQKQFAKGKRCAVCGMTKSEIEAIGYDCYSEC